MRSFEQLMLILVVLFLAFGVWGIIAAAIAQHKGRSVIGWFFGGVFLQLIGVVIVAVMPNLREDQTHRQWMENENRRLRERLRQEQVKSEAFRTHATARLDVHDGRLGVDTRDANPALPEPGPERLSLPEAPRILTVSRDTGKVGSNASTLAGAAPAAQPAARKWHYEMDGRVLGPVPERAIILKIQDGELNESTLVWTEGQDDWEKVENIPKLRHHL